MREQCAVAIGANGIGLVYESSEDAEIVRVYGEVDIRSADEFGAAILAAYVPDRAITIDLSSCRYVDSSALAVLIRVRERCGEQVRLLIQDHSNVARLLDIVDFGRIFTIDWRPSEP